MADEEAQFLEYTHHELKRLDHGLVDSRICIRSRIHTIRKQGQLCFIVLRYGNASIQAVGHKKGINDFQELVKMPVESVIEIRGVLKKSPFEITFTSHKTFEIGVESWSLVSRANPLPFLIDDANDFGDSFRSDVGNQIRYDHRWLDLRVPVNGAIFRLQSAIGNLFREYLLGQGFIEIHTPKTIGVKSEGGANVFELGYFDKKAYLAQSPQLYKQMAINADMDRVFEVGPIFRAEYSFSKRHLCEYTGLDLEMAISSGQDYHQVIETYWATLVHIFDGLKSGYSKEIETVREKLPFVNIIYPNQPLIIPWQEGVGMLKEVGVQQDLYEDLSTEAERKLGELVKQKYDSDLFVLFGYPRTARPFYTMLDPNDENYTLSWDVICRGQEISSGAQREHRYDKLIDRVTSCGVDPSNLVDYIDSFSHGSVPHGGTGFGLERILTFFLDLDNIRQASFCPRDPKRLNP